MEIKYYIHLNPPIFQSLVHNNFTKELIKEGRKLSEKDDWGNRLDRINTNMVVHITIN